MMTVPMKVLVHVGWLSIYCCVMSSLPSLSGVIKMSRNGTDPSGLGSSVVYWMLLSTEFRWVRNSSLWAFFMMTNVSSTNLFHTEGGLVMIVGLSLHNWADGRAHGSSFHLLIEFSSVGEISAPQAELQ